MVQASIDPDLYQELREIAECSGCELLHCEFHGRVLRLYLDRPEGVSLEDCQSVSKQVSTLLDVHNLGSGKYLLEVSSPGLDRKFYRPDDYERFLGQSVRITWQEATMDTKKTVVGRLKAYNSSEAGGDVTVVDADTGRRYTISLKNIQLARLEPQL